MACGVKVDVDKVKAGLELIRRSSALVEFRTTCLPGLVDVGVLEGGGFGVAVVEFAPVLARHVSREGDRGIGRAERLDGAGDVDVASAAARGHAVDQDERRRVEPPQVVSPLMLPETVVTGWADQSTSALLVWSPPMSTCRVKSPEPVAVTRALPRPL